EPGAARRDRAAAHSRRAPSGKWQPHGRREAARHQPPRALPPPRAPSPDRGSAAGHDAASAVTAALSGPELEPPYRELFDGAPIGIYVSRPDGTLAACNPAFARMLGFASVDLALTANMHDIHEDGRDRERLVASVHSEGRLEHHRGRLRRRDGSLLHVIETA